MSYEFKAPDGGPGQEFEGVAGKTHDGPALPGPLRRVMASVIRHARAHLEGDRGQDHPAAVACGAFALMLYREQARKGRLPAERDDFSEELSRFPLCGT